MAHRTLSRRTVTAGVAVALLMAGLMVAGLSSQRPAAADEHDDSGGLVGDVVDAMADDEDDGEQEAADGGETQEVEPESGEGGGDGSGQEPAQEEPAPEEPAPEEPPAEEPSAQEPAAEEPSGGGGNQEPAAGQAAEQPSGGSAPVPSGPRTASGPRLNPSAGLPEGENASASFDSSAGNDAFASAPEVFTEDGGDRARRPDELALANLPRENGPANAEPTGSVPSRLVAAATGLLVTVGVGHVLYATRRVDDELWDDAEPSGDGDGESDGDEDPDEA